MTFIFFRHTPVVLEGARHRLKKKKKKKIGILKEYAFENHQLPQNLHDCAGFHKHFLYMLWSSHSTLSPWTEK